MKIKNSIRGFTLLEVIIMVGILALLATLLINKTGGIFANAQVATTKIFVRDTLKTPLERYRMDMGSYPTTAEGLAALLTAPGSAADRWRGPYIEAPNGKLDADPWGEAYQYRYPGTKNKNTYDLFSKGPDKSEGTDDDIGNW
jgi:general secretion pathway protein G